MSLLGAAQSYAAWIYQIYIGEKLVLQHRVKVFEHALSLSLRHHDSRGVADLQYRLQSDVYNMQFLAVYGLLPFCGSLATFVMMLAITLRLDWQLATLALGVIPALGLVNRNSAGRSRRKWADHKVAEQTSVGILQETLGNVRVVKAFATEQREASRYEGAASSTLGRLIAAMGTDALFGFLISAVVAVASAAALYLGILHVQRGLLSLGSFLLVLTYLGQLFKPLETLGKQVATIQGALASAERVYSLLDELPDIADSEQPVVLSKGYRPQRIEFRDAAFGFRPDHYVLQKLSFTVEAGQQIGVVGPTGAGKTTLIYLLARLHDVTAGQVLFDDVDVRKISLTDLRRLFSFVPQEPVLFSGTVADNIAYGIPEATAEDIQAAAKAAQAHELIVRMPLGYQTRLGERGAGLSGGERQRISIARAFLRDAPILVLDEPTSAVDGEMAADIAASLERLQNGRTVFTISHDGSLLQSYDLILRIGGGTVQASRWLTPPVVEVDDPLTERRKRERALL